MDLSSPHDYSVNDGINPELCSLKYAAIDQAMLFIQIFGRGALLAKIDLQNAYRVVPVHPIDQPLLGMKWNGTIYRDTVLPFGLHSAPLSEHTHCLFVAYLSQQNIQSSSIRTYLSSLRHLQISSGLPNPFTLDSFPRLTYVLRGIKRTAPSQPNKRLPITPEILRLIWHQWSTPPISYETRLLWAACCLGFFGFLRIGEFTARSSRNIPQGIVAFHDIQRADSLPPEFIRVHLRHSKTDPFGKGVHIFLGRTQDAVCPVAAILSFIAIRPQHFTGPLFSVPRWLYPHKEYVDHSREEGS